MASIKYLWQHRSKPPISSINFYRVWAKRLLLLPDLLQMSYRRRKLLSKGANINERAEIGHVKIEGPKAKLSVGAYSFLGRVYIALHGSVEIGERVCINDGVEILTASHDIADPAWKHIVRDVIIEDYAWIGTGAMILPGVTIGRGAVVGARAVVSKSVAAGAIVVGNPARPVNKTRAEHLDYNPCAFLAANLAWLADR